MSIVERIKQKCTEKGININTLENNCGLGHATIRRWDNNSPAVEKVEIVANLLEVSLDWLITGKEAADLTPEEQQLVDYYRRADERGKRTILRTAESESMELESSSSRIG